MKLSCCKSTICQAGIGWIYKLLTHSKDLWINFHLLLFQAEPACQLTDRCVAGWHCSEERKTKSGSFAPGSDGNRSRSLDALSVLPFALLAYLLLFFLNKRRQMAMSLKEKRQTRSSLLWVSVFAETWSPWQPWSPCSVTCGDGVRERFRECLTSSPARPGCAGPPRETSLCSLEECLCA